MNDDDLIKSKVDPKKTKKKFYLSSYSHCSSSARPITAQQTSPKNDADDSANLSKNALFFEFKRTVLDVLSMQTQERLRGTSSNLSSSGGSNNKYKKRQCSPPPMDSSQPNLIFLMGIPGSGKSTWAKDYLLNQDPTCIIISSDAVRMEITGSIGDQSQNKLVWEVVLCQCQELLMSRHNVILDATNVDTEKRRTLLRRLITLDQPNIQNAVMEKAANAAARARKGCKEQLSHHTAYNGDDEDAKSAVTSSAHANEDIMNKSSPSHDDRVFSSSSSAMASTDTTNSCVERAEGMIRDAVSSRGGSLIESPRESYCDEALPPTVSRLKEGLNKVTPVKESLLLKPPIKFKSTPSTSIHDHSSQSDSNTNVILCNRLLKVFTVDKAVAKERIQEDISNRAVRANVPPIVVDAMQAKFVESMGVLWEEDWILLD